MKKARAAKGHPRHFQYRTHGQDTRGLITPCCSLFSKARTTLCDKGPLSCPWDI